MLTGETRRLSAVASWPAPFQVTGLTAAVYDASGDSVPASVGATFGEDSHGSAVGGGEPCAPCYSVGVGFHFTAPVTAGDYLWQLTVTLDNGETLILGDAVRVLPAPPNLPAYHVAKARLRSMVEAATQPILTDDDLDDLLAAAAVATVWQASQAYLYGAAILPTVGNGTMWRVVSAGTSGATEPVWPTAAVVGPAFGYAPTFTDGTVVWEYAGSAPVGAALWDLRAAANAGWTLKAGRALQLEIDPILDAEGKGSQPNVGRERDAIRAHCLTMADRYAPLFVV